MKRYQNYSLKLNHLSNLEIEELKRSYYLGVGTKKLVEKYNIDISPNKLIQTFPLVKTRDKKCPYCKVEMYFISPSKTNKNRKEYLCITCQHKESLFGCKCRNCLLQRALEKQEYIEKNLYIVKKTKMSF